MKNYCIINFRQFLQTVETRVVTGNSAKNYLYSGWEEIKLIVRFNLIRDLTFVKHTDVMNNYSRIAFTTSPDHYLFVLLYQKFNSNRIIKGEA